MLQGNPNPLWEPSGPFQSGASLKCNLVIAGNVGNYCHICRAVNSVLLGFSGQKPFWKHLHLCIYNNLTAYVTRKSNPQDFNHIRVNTAPLENDQESTLRSY